MESDRHYLLGEPGAVGARAGQPQIHAEEATVGAWVSIFPSASEETKEMPLLCFAFLVE